MSSLYQDIGGFDKVFELANRWHHLVLNNPETSHPFEHGIHPYHAERLAAYLAEAFGGPRLYSAGYGNESSVQKLHACNGEHIDLDLACLAEFRQALADCGITGETAVRTANYFQRAIERQRDFSGPHAKVPTDLPFNLELPNA